MFYYAHHHTSEWPILRTFIDGGSGCEAPVGTFGSQYRTTEPEGASTYSACTVPQYKNCLRSFSIEWQSKTITSPKKWPFLGERNRLCLHEIYTIIFLVFHMGLEIKKNSDSRSCL